MATIAPTFKSNEPRARGIPVDRYSRPLIRTNALVQDSNCLNAPPAPILFEGQLAWENRLDNTFAAANFGLLDLTSSTLVTLNFAVLNVINFTGVTVTSTRTGLAFNGGPTGPVVAYDTLTGLGSVTFSSSANYAPGILNLTLRNNGLAAGQLVVSLVDDGNDGYDNLQWLAYTAL